MITCLLPCAVKKTKIFLQRKKQKKKKAFKEVAKEKNQKETE